jgi:SAM-dependent methyltransferase
MKNAAPLYPVFGKDYSDYYDLFYQEKDYEAECDMIEGIFRRHGNGSIITILDLGCGTGNHALPLSLRNYNMTGVDCSEEMLRQARKKMPSASNPIFLKGDIRTLDLERGFDAVLMMFAVLGYQLTNEDVLAALRSVRRHLVPGGLFICDVWYGPAVLAERPVDRIKVIPTADGKILRTASGRLDIMQHLVNVDYQIWHIRGNEVINESNETHRMRYFFPQELSFFFSLADLELLSLRAFGEQDKALSEATWNAIAVARVINGPQNAKTYSGKNT